MQNVIDLNLIFTSPDADDPEIAPVVPETAAFDDAALIEYEQQHLGIGKTIKLYFTLLSFLMILELFWFPLI